MNDRLKRPRKSDRLVLEALHDGPKTAEQLASILNMSMNNVYVVATRMMREGFPVTSTRKMGLPRVLNKSRVEFYLRLDRIQESAAYALSHNGEDNG